MKATGKPILDMVLDYILDKKNWKQKTIESGYIENIKIEVLGNYIAKMDTGNSSYCVIHADDWKIDNNYITWTHNGKSYEHKFEGMKKVKRGGMVNKTEERPVISLDVTFNGNTYKDIKFVLSNRTDLTTPILMNRKFIEMAGLVINPALKYALSVKKGKEGEEKEIEESSKKFRDWI
jgi:hypothetical protein